MAQSAGLVLAGGRSSRMGRDKARLELAEGDLLAHMIRLLRRVGAAPVVVSGDYPERGGVADLVPDRGPVGGIASCLDALAPADGFWVVPVDMPALTPELLRPLAGARAAYYLDHPLPAYLPLPATRALLAGDAGRERSVRQLLAELDAAALPVRPEDLPALANLNTPEEWRRWRPA